MTELGDSVLENFTLKARQTTLRWYGWTLSLVEGNKVKQTVKMKVRGTRVKGKTKNEVEGQDQA